MRGHGVLPGQAHGITPGFIDDRFTTKPESASVDVSVQIPLSSASKDVFYFVERPSSNTLLYVTMQ